MSPETTTIRVLTIPEVRVCCLKCEDEGTRRGVWVPIDEVDDVCVDAVHRGRVARLDRGVDLHTDAELAVLETRHMPVAGPLSSALVEAWAEVYSEVGEHDWPALLAWMDSGSWVEVDGMPSTSDFRERHCGQWPSFDDYARDYAEDTGLMQGWPEDAKTFFDWPRWTRDQRYGYTIVDATQGGVYLFQDL